MSTENTFRDKDEIERVSSEGRLRIPQDRNSSKRALKGVFRHREMTEDGNAGLGVACVGENDSSFFPSVDSSGQA